MSKKVENKRGVVARKVKGFRDIDSNLNQLKWKIINAASEVYKSYGFEHWETPVLMDAVVMNPPFHRGKAGDPGLGQAFIQSAARNMKPTGKLWMVANRHLPYEETIASLFAKVIDLGGNQRFKLICAERPKRRR